MNRKIKSLIVGSVFAALFLFTNETNQLEARGGHGGHGGRSGRGGGNRHRDRDHHHHDDHHHNDHNHHTHIRGRGGWWGGNGGWDDWDDWRGNYGYGDAYDYYSNTNPYTYVDTSPTDSYGNFRYNDTFSIDEGQCQSQNLSDQNSIYPNSGCYSSKGGVFLDPQ